jgi:hypothetical protein
MSLLHWKNDFFLQFLGNKFAFRLEFLFSFYRIFFRSKTAKQFTTRLSDYAACYCDNSRETLFNWTSTPFFSEFSDINTKGRKAFLQWHSQRQTSQRSNGNCYSSLEQESCEKSWTSE